MTWQTRGSRITDDLNYTGPILRDEMRMILNATLDGVIIQSEDHKVQFANSAATRRFGDRVQQVCNKLVERAGRRPTCPIHCIVDEAGEAEGFCYDGDEKHLRVLVTGSNGEEGIPKNVVVVRDITNIKRLQQDLEQSHRLRVLGQMMLGVAHDFSNMLSAVLGRAQLLQQRLYDRSALESGLKAIEKLAMNAAKTTRWMQHFSGSKKDTTFAPVALNEVTNHVVQITRHSWQDQAQKDGASILVIDDQAMIRELFREVLVRDGYELALASGSSEGLRAFDKGYFDIVYTDLGMPGISGWQVASEIKKRKPGTVVVMTTGCKIQMDEEELGKNGVDFVLTKPFQIQQLRDSVIQAMKIKRNR